MTERNDQMKEELLKMNQSVFVPEDVVTKAPGTDAPGTSAPDTDAPTTDIPDDITTDAPKTNAPSTEVPSTDAPTTDAPDEMTLLRQEIELLKAENKKSITTDAPGTDTPTTEVPFSNEDFIGDLDISDVINDPDKLNEVLNSVLKKGIEMARGIATTGNETTLKSIPDIVKSNLTLISNLKQASTKFYDDNKDLVQWKSAVASVFEEVASKNPDKSHIENLKTTGIEVRKRLKLKAQAIDKDKDKDKDKNKPPKLPGNNGNKRKNQKPKTKGMVSEIDAMNKSI